MFREKRLRLPEAKEGRYGMILFCISFNNEVFYVLLVLLLWRDLGFSGNARCSSVLMGSPWGKVAKVQGNSERAECLCDGPLLPHVSVWGQVRVWVPRMQAEEGQRPLFHGVLVACQSPGLGTCCVRQCCISWGVKENLCMRLSSREYTRLGFRTPDLSSPVWH